MPVVIAYLCVIVIWSTTPLALQWSIDGVGFLFGVAARMWIGALLALLLCALLRANLPLNRGALLTYLAGGLGAYSTMLLLYWGAQYIPSGWISVVFGIAPIFTSVMDAIILKDRSVGLAKGGALFIALTGLAVIFFQGASMDLRVLPGLFAVVFGTICYSASLVAIKHLSAPITPMASMTGTLIIAALLYLVTWYISGNSMPEQIPVRTAGSILYMAIIASVIGFILFYYVLGKTNATRTALITMITPVCALILGNLFNNEPLTIRIWLGTLLVLSGLLLYQFGGLIRARFARNTVTY